MVHSSTSKSTTPRTVCNSRKNSQYSSGLKSNRTDSSLTLASLPKIENKSGLPNEALNRWNKAERRLTIVSFPRALTDRKRKVEFEKEIREKNERERRFRKAQEGVLTLTSQIEQSGNFFDHFCLPPIIGDNSEIVNYQSTLPYVQDVNFEKRVKSFKHFCSFHNVLQSERSKFFDTYGKHIIRRRQYNELKNKLGQKERIINIFENVSSITNENELISKFNQMTNQFAVFSFKLCHIISKQETGKNVANVDMKSGEGCEKDLTQIINTNQEFPNKQKAMTLSNGNLISQESLLKIDDKIKVTCERITEEHRAIEKLTLLLNKM
uniref:Uncharacterized protein n=1 Tax=Rhabditophanes sp. KR3021 TaxID=114890 RepID=A0AC35U788_9BILA